ncbi:hypothetical protein M405DRAFT_353046 [Rhizopogon salebrosus TDB-379]|nr:hypothetical protein M405DRAFT_353046 [Rhizopogon salebrosus TDB-379]
MIENGLPNSNVKSSRSYCLSSTCSSYLPMPCCPSLYYCCCKGPLVVLSDSFSLVVLALSETCASPLHSSGVQDVDSDLKGDGLDSDVCLHALGGMCWIFFKSHEREKAVHII